MAIAGLYKTFEDWGSTGTTWIYSDTHFNDEDMIALCGYPSAEEHIKKINSKVGRADTFILLGDVGNVEFVKQIRARKKILVMGNHDAGRTNYERVNYHERFEIKHSKEDVIDSMRCLYPNCQYVALEACGFRPPFEWWDVCADNRLFDEVYEGPVMISEKLILSHEPIDVPWAFNIHGHVHDDYRKNDKRHFCVAANKINYTPINFNQWMKQGYLSKIEDIHRTTIDTATARSKKKGKRYV